MTIQDYINTVTSNSAQRILKIEILDSQENVIGSITPNIMGGDLQITSESSSRRNCNISLDNSSGIFTPISGGQFWINTKYRLYTGYLVDGEDYYVSRGIFVCGEPQVISDGANKTVNLQLYDKWALLDDTLGGALKQEYVINAGYRIDEAVRGIFAEFGEVKTPIIFPTNETLPWNLVRSAGETYGNILQDLANMMSWVCYYDYNGYPRFEPPTDLTLEGSSWDYSTDEITYLGNQHRYEYSKVKNYIVVIGDNINGLNIRAEAFNSDPTSGTRVSLIGEKVKVITDELISTLDLAQKRADYELTKAVSLVETVSLESVPIDILDVDQIITVTDTSNGLNSDRYLIKNISFPLMNTGNQTLNVWKGIQGE